MLRSVVKPGLEISAIFPSKVPVRKYIPRRGILYVPGDDSKKIHEAFESAVDCIALDCEDGVILDKKEQARQNIRLMLDSGKPKRKRNYDFCVRVNAANGGDLMREDLNVILTGPNLPDTIYLPRVETNDHLKLFSNHLDEYVKKKVKIGLIIAIESPLALINVVEMCKTVINMSDSKIKLVALVFGCANFCTNLGAKETETSFEVIYARQKVVTVAKAFDLQAIDMVFRKYKDLDDIKKQAEEGARIGYSGKQMTEPDQIEVVQNAFTPTRKEVEWARTVMKEFHKHQQEGQGLFSYKGSIVRMPTMRHAQNIIDLVNALMIEQ